MRLDASHTARPPADHSDRLGHGRAAPHPHARRPLPHDLVAAVLELGARNLAAGPCAACDRQPVLVVGAVVPVAPLSTARADGGVDGRAGTAGGPAPGPPRWLVLCAACADEPFGISLARRRAAAGVVGG